MSPPSLVMISSRLSSIEWQKRAVAALGRVQPGLQGGGKGMEGERSREGRGGSQGHLGSLDGRGADVRRAVPGRGHRQDQGRPRRVDGTKTRLGSWGQRLRACPGAKVPCQFASRVVPVSLPPSRQPPALRVTEAFAGEWRLRRGPAACRSRDSPRAIHQQSPRVRLERQGRVSQPRRGCSPVSKATHGT